MQILFQNTKERERNRNCEKGRQRHANKGMKRERDIYGGRERCIVLTIVRGMSLLGMQGEPVLRGRGTCLTGLMPC